MCARSVLILSLSVAAALPGCVADRSDDLSIGREIHLEAIDPRNARALEPLSNEPSLIDPSRVAWGRHIARVPLDQGTRGWKLGFREPTGRPREARGHAPDPAVAIGREPIPVGDAVSDAITDPFVAAADLVLMIPRAIGGGYEEDFEGEAHTERTP